MSLFSELQRQRVLKRWQKQDTADLSKAVLDIEQRKTLLAPLIAYLQGDGFVSLRYEKNHETAPHHELAFYPDHIKVAKIFVKLYRQLYGRKLRIEKLENHFRVRSTQRIAYKELIKITEFRSTTWYIPTRFLDNCEKKKLWLRAFYDCEAYVGPKSIVVQSVNKYGLKQVQRLLAEFGMSSRFYQYVRKQKNWNTNYLLALFRKEDRQNFLKEIGFNHPNKQKKLIQYLAGVA